MRLALLIRTIQELNPKPRLFISLGLAGLTLLLPTTDWQVRALTAWDTGMYCFLGLVWLMMSCASGETTRARAQHQEADHTGIFLLVIFAAFTSLFVIGLVLTQHKDTFNTQVALSVAAILASWLLLHTMFALHYARFFYRRDRDNPDQWMGGLEFTPADTAIYLPSYWDFIYFTFTLGMTSQTSDTVIACSTMRRLALGHTIVSFFFYSVILALTVSVVSGLL